MKRFLLTLMLVATVVSVSAQRRPDSMSEYRRSSLYSLLITHSKMDYSSEISTAFNAMPLPDKFNDHSLAISSFESSVTKPKEKANSKKKHEANLADINQFLVTNNIAKQMVAKWYNRDAETGLCNRNLINERGLYDASQQDIELADESIYGRAQLGDQGEDLIRNTYVIFNDITFSDKGKKSEGAAIGLAIFGGIVAAVTGIDAVSDAANLAATAVNEIDGFRVNVTSYLYRLVWNDETRDCFESNYYVSARMDEETRTARKLAFDALQGEDCPFKLEYVGFSTAHGGITTSKSFSEKSKSEQMLIACARGVDNAIVELQRTYEEFKVNTPIYQVNDDGTVDVKIGLKEGVNSKSVYNVLQEVQDEEGNISYKVIGTIVPIEGKIWDNRFGALEEAEALKADPDAKQSEEAKEGNAYLTATTFKVRSGNSANFIGCVVREAKIGDEKK